MSDLRSKLIRLAASEPPRSESRRKILAILKEASDLDDAKTVTEFYGRRFHNSFKSMGNDSMSLGHESRGNRHPSGHGLHVRKSPHTDEYTRPDLVSGHAGRSEQTPQEASKILMKYTSGWGFFDQMLEAFAGGVVVGPKYADAVHEYADAIRGGLDVKDRTERGVYEQAIWKALREDAQGGRLLSPRFFYYTTSYSGYDRSF